MYTSQEKIEAILKRSLTEQEEEIIDDLVNATSAFIRRFTGRNWDCDEESTRYYDGTKSYELFVDDFTDIEEVKIDGEVQDLDDLIFYPLNTPYHNSIYHKGAKWAKGHANIEITANWSSGELPYDVALVASNVVVSYLRKASIDGNLKKESIEGYSYELRSASEIDGDIQSALAPLLGYKKVRV